MVGKDFGTHGTSNIGVTDARVGSKKKKRGRENPLCSKDQKRRQFILKKVKRDRQRPPRGATIARNRARYQNKHGGGKSLGGRLMVDTNHGKTPSTDEANVGEKV